MGKSIRSNNKKAIRTLRREAIVKAPWVVEAERKKQEAMQQILQAPKPEPANVTRMEDVSRQDDGGAVPMEAVKSTRSHLAGATQSLEVEQKKGGIPWGKKGKVQKRQAQNRKKHPVVVAAEGKKMFHRKLTKGKKGKRKPRRI